MKKMSKVLALLTAGALLFGCMFTSCSNGSGGGGNESGNESGNGSGNENGESGGNGGFVYTDVYDFQKTAFFGTPQRPHCHLDRSGEISPAAADHFSVLSLKFSVFIRYLDSPNTQFPSPSFSRTQFPTWYCSRYIPRR